VKNMKKSLIFLLFCLICEEVFAGVFSVIPTDRSQYYLGMVFGGSVGSITLGGPNNPTLALMFERFNFIIVTIGAVVLSYIGIMTTINTAREGEAMGKKISMWVPLRAFSGMLLMIPGPTTGYSVVQMTVMWIVLNGIGAANSVWNVVLAQLSQGVSVVGGLNIGLQPSDLNNLTQSVLNANTCLYTIKNYMPELSQNAGPMQNKSISIYSVVNNPSATPLGAPTTISQQAIVFVGVEGAPAPLDRLCGFFTINTQLDNTNTQNTFNLATLRQRLTIKTQALLSMFTAVDPAAMILADPSYSPTSGQPDPGYINAAERAYIAQITQLAMGINAAPGSGAQGWEAGANQINPITNDYQTLKSYGWIHAGSYYFTMMSQANDATDPETAQTAPLPNGSNVPQQATIVNNALSPAGSVWPTLSNTGSGLESILSPAAPNFQVYKMSTALQNAMTYWTNDARENTPATQGLAVGQTSTGNRYLDKIVNGIKNKIQRPIIQYMQKVASGSVNSSSGVTGIAGGIGAAYNATTGFGTAAYNAVAGTNYAAPGTLDSSTTGSSASGDPLISIGQFGGTLMLAAEMSAFASIVTSFIVSLALSGASAANPLAWALNLVFVQVLPLIYSVAIILWTMGATLGIYLPLVPYLVFTMTAFGWVIQVIEAVVAAPIIALGLVHPAGGEELGKIAAALPIIANIFLRPTLMIFGFVLGASLLRAGIALVNFGFIPAIQTSAATSIFSILAVLGLYVGIVTSIVNKSFSLIYVLPNQIMRWMGGQGEGGDPSDMVKESKGSFDTGAGAGQKGLDQAAAAGKSKMAEVNKKMQENKKK
jgi:conjugal transfer/type IV secretion protein DotA/TraY